MICMTHTYMNNIGTQFKTSFVTYYYNGTIYATHLCMHRCVKCYYTTSYSYYTTVLLLLLLLLYYLYYYSCYYLYYYSINKHFKIHINLNKNFK
jgi:hypothetical protein